MSLAKMLFKEVFLPGALYGSSAIASIMVPSMIAAAISTTKISKFCHTNTDICDNYVNPLEKNPNVTLPDAVRKYTLLTSSIDSAIILPIMFLVLIALYKLITVLAKCSKKDENTKNEKTGLLNNQANINNRCHFFKKCKERILPKKFDSYKWLATVTFFIGCSAFVVWDTATVAQNSICNESKNSTVKCSFFFPNATAAQLSLVDHTAQTAFNTIMRSGMGLELLITLVTVTITIGIISCYQSRDADDDSNDNTTHFVNVN